MGFSFSEKLWRYTGEKASWFFITLDKAFAEKIKEKAGKRRGWGSVKVEVTIGQTTWATSIFPDKRRGFVLPIKAAVRKAEGIEEGALVKGSFNIKGRL